MDGSILIGLEGSKQQAEISILAELLDECNNVAVHPAVLANLEQTVGLIKELNNVNSKKDQNLRNLCTDFKPSHIFLHTIPTGGRFPSLYDKKI